MVTLAVMIFLPTKVWGITLAPATLELKVAAGQSQEFKIKLFNEEDKTVFLLASLKKFVSQGTEGSAKILVTTAQDEYLNWFNLPGRYTKLAPGEMQEITLKISIPAKAAPAEYFPVLAWQTLTGTNSGDNLAVSSEVGTLIFLQITGPKEEKLSLQNFSLPTKQQILWSWPKKFLVQVQNEGNIHLVPQGNIKLAGYWQKTPLILAVNEGQGKILPNSQRVYEVFLPQRSSSMLASLKKFLVIGKYQATLNLTYGETNKSLTQMINFWVISWPAVSLFGVLLIILGYNLIKFNAKRQ